MSKVLIFSSYFPAYHPKKGQPTRFVEKIWHSFYEQKLTSLSLISETSRNNNLCGDLFVNEVKEYITRYEPKHHTVRGGNRHKEGDYFSPRVWSGMPYKSKQIIIAPDIEVKKIFDFEIRIKSNSDLSGFADILINDKFIDPSLLTTVAINDGLEYGELLNWFKYPSPFKGQIICWNPNINY